MVGKVSVNMTKNDKKNKPEQDLTDLRNVTTSEKDRKKISERGAMTKPFLGSTRAKKIMEKNQTKRWFLIDEARKKMHFVIFVLVMTFLVHLIVSPFILRECVGQRPDVILDIPLKEAPYLPATLNYTLDDAYMIKNNNFTGVLFSHNDLKPDYRMHFFSKSVEFLPLASFVQSEYNDYAMVRYAIAAYFPLIVSYVFGVLLYSVYDIVGLYFATGAKKRSVAAVKIKVRVAKI